MKRCNIRLYLNQIDSVRDQNGLHCQECECGVCDNYGVDELVKGIIIMIEVMNEIGIPEVEGYDYTPELHVMTFLSSITFSDDAGSGVTGYVNYEASKMFVNDERAVSACKKFNDLYNIDIIGMINHAMDNGGE